DRRCGLLRVTVGAEGAESREGLDPVIGFEFGQQFRAPLVKVLALVAQILATDLRHLCRRLFFLTVPDCGAGDFSGGSRPAKRTPTGSGASRHGSGAGSVAPPGSASPRGPA